MSLELFYSEDALEDLATLKEWLEENMPAKSNEILRAILETCKMLPTMPELGAVVHRYPTKIRLRSLVVKKYYLVLYSLEPNAIYIVRVLDGRRDVGKIIADL